MPQQMSKQLINQPETCVPEVVKGLLYSNPQLLQVKDTNALVHSHIDQVRAKQVTVISGGGSGHEPAHAGYIGDGMLSGAVLGHVFASPSVQSILSTIRVAAGPAGILIVVKNYTGDRLNFGMALEKAKNEGIRGRLLVVDDDCALPPGKGITGGRGIAGTVLIHKLAGSLASSGRSLESIHTFLSAILPALRTMGVALTACHLPGQTAAAASGRLSGAREIEVGMGIHGEQGRESAELPASGAAKYVAGVLVESVLSRLQISDDDATGDYRPVVILINNLGSLPALEQAIVLKDVTEQLLQRRCLPVRVYAGSFMTSLDMNGISLSVLNMSAFDRRFQEEILGALDSSVSAPAWSAAKYSQGLDSITPTFFDVSQRCIAPPAAATSSDVADAVELENCVRVSSALLDTIRRMCQRIIDLEARLSEYDAVCGDGDCGMVLKQGAQGVLGKLAGVAEGISAPRLFDLLADTVSDHMGGTSGALLEICFRAMSTHFISAARAGVSSDSVWYDALHNGLLAIRLYGGADVGMRTMLDALVPAVAVVCETQGNLVEAAARARAGMESTKEMISLAGRANYVSIEKMRGVPDPGAVAVAAIFAEAAGVPFD